MLLDCDVAAAAVAAVAAALWSSPVENVECREGSWFPAPVFLLGCTSTATAWVDQSPRSPWSTWLKELPFSS